MDPMWSFTGSVERLHPGKGDSRSDSITYSGLINYPIFRWDDSDSLLLKACTDRISVAETVTPRSEAVAAYKAGYQKWRKLYPALATLR